MAQPQPPQAGLHRVESRSVQVQACDETREDQRDCVNGTRVEQESGTEENGLRFRRPATVSTAGAATADPNTT